MTFNLDDCSNPEAKCMTMSNIQWMPFVTISDGNEVKVDLSNYVVP